MRQVVIITNNKVCEIYPILLIYVFLEKIKEKEIMQLKY